MLSTLPLVRLAATILGDTGAADDAAPAVACSRTFARCLAGFGITSGGESGSDAAVAREGLVCKTSHSEHERATQTNKREKKRELAPEAQTGHADARSQQTVPRLPEQCWSACWQTAGPPLTPSAWTAL